MLTTKFVEVFLSCLSKKVANVGLAADTHSFSSGPWSRKGCRPLSWYIMMVVNNTATANYIKMGAF